MSSREWFYIGKFGQVGPLPEEHAFDLASCGVIAPDTYVWSEGMADWKRADEVDEYRTRVPRLSKPPPVPRQGHLTNSNLPQAAVSSLPYVWERPMSPLSRTAGGVLNIVLPGVGRMYLGYVGTGVLQLVLTICSGGLLYFWPLIDGILMLAGTVREDGSGRTLVS